VIDIPVAAKTDADKLAYCYRALELYLGELWFEKRGRRKN